MSARKRKGLAQLARERLEQEASPEKESEEMKKMRAEGWLFLGGREGLVILPPVTPDE